MFFTSENYWCGQRLNATEAVDLLAGFVGDLVAGFQIVVLQMAFQITAHRPLGNGTVAVFLTPHLVDGIQIPGGDGAVCFQLDVPLRLHKLHQIVGVSLGVLLVFRRPLAHREAIAVGLQPL